MDDQRHDAELIANAGELIWGQNWQSEMSRVLDINLRTIQRIAAAAKNGTQYNSRRELLQAVAVELNHHIAECQEFLYDFHDRLNGPERVG